jgi:glycine cleavage system H protein
MNIPQDLKYTSDHEWVRIDAGQARVGITDYAQDALGDVVFVEVPAVGSSVEIGGSMGEVESTKSVSDIYAPLTGTVIEVNELLDGTPGKLNEDPYGDGWLCVMSVDDDAQLDGLLDADSYRELIGE